MPFSIDPQPGENEFECGRCGAVVRYDMTRCPQCGVNLFEPEDELNGRAGQKSGPAGAGCPGILAKAESFLRRLLGKPYTAEEVFGDALNQAVLYNDLLIKVGGDHATVERLIEFEKKQAPGGPRLLWIQNAIRRWERDNRAHGKLE